MVKFNADTRMLMKIAPEADFRQANFPNYPVFLYKRNQMGTTEFYSELGKILYAIANADGRISAQETAEISNQIRERLLHREVHTDRFGSNRAWVTQFAFDTAAESNIKPLEALNDFMDFARSQADRLTDQEIDTCLHMCDQIADAYHHRNKKENELIGKLRGFLMELHSAHLIF